MKRTMTIVAGLMLASGMAVAQEQGETQDKKFSDIDTDGDGRISQTEIQEGWSDKMVQDYFARADDDYDGYLTQTEFQEFQELRNEEEEAE